MVATNATTLFFMKYPADWSPCDAASSLAVMSRIGQPERAKLVSQFEFRPRVESRHLPLCITGATDRLDHVDPTQPFFLTTMRFHVTDARIERDILGHRLVRVELDETVARRH
jgi:hypothetical protein